MKYCLSRSRLALLSTLLGVLSCTTPAPRTPPSEAEPPAQPVTVAPELTVDERHLAEELRVHVSHLAEKIGERNAKKSWELADAADYIALTLEESGIAVERLGYETEDVAAQNLAVTIGGGMKGDEILLVGAHYDSPPGVPGMNAGATGAAALLSLVRLMRDARLLRTLRIVFFAMGETPHGDGEGRGARHFARSLLEEAKKNQEKERPDGLPTPTSEVLGLVHLDRLGALSPLTGPSDGPLTVDLTSTPGAQRIFELMNDSLEDEPVHVVSERFQQGKGDSDVLAFYDLGIPVVAVSGPAGEEKPVSYDSLARVVMRIRRGIGRILGEQPTNDGMLTPLGDNLR